MSLGCCPTILGWRSAGGGDRRAHPFPQGSLAPGFGPWAHGAGDRGRCLTVARWPPACAPPFPQGYRLVSLQTL